MDEMDRPEPDEEMELAVPFVVCASKGGPYDDEAFVAGFQCGEVDRALKVAQAVEAHRVRATVRTALLPQLELIGMNRGFPGLVHEEWEPAPEWSFVMFIRGEPDDG